MINAVIAVLGNNLYDFGICTKIPELLSALMELTHKREELVTVYRSFDIEVEAVLELALGNLAALKLYEVDTGCIEA